MRATVRRAVVSAGIVAVFCATPSHSAHPNATSTFGVLAPPAPWQKVTINDLIAKVRSNDRAGLAKRYPKIQAAPYDLFGLALSDKSCQLIEPDVDLSGAVRLKWDCGGVIGRLWAVKFEGREIVELKNNGSLLEFPVLIPVAPPRETH